IGFFFEPTRASLSFTANALPPSGLALVLPLLRRRATRRRGRNRTVAAELGRERRHLPLPHLLHHLLHLLAPLEQLVHLLDRRAGAIRDPDPPLAVDQVRHRALPRRHREHDRLDALHLLLVDLEVPELLAEAGDHLQAALERPHPAQHLVGAQEVVERELTLAEARRLRARRRRAWSSRRRRTRSAARMPARRSRPPGRSSRPGRAGRSSA